MKKIYKLKQWYSIKDAANRLTQTLSESVQEFDILELALEGHIQLYWYMRHVPSVEVEFGRKKLQPLIIKGKKISFESDNGIEYFIDSYSEVNPNSDITRLNGAHQLLLEQCGALVDYLRSFITGTGGELVSINGYYVKDTEGKTWNIVERFDETYFNNSDQDKDSDFGRYYNSRNYYPSPYWPVFTELGFTKAELEKFEGQLNDNVVQEIKPKQRATLLKIISAMAKDGYGYDSTASRSPFPKELEGILDNLGMPVSDDTIRKWLKEASEYLPQENDTD
jgi:hypothetical protein